MDYSFELSNFELTNDVGGRDGLRQCGALAASRIILPGNSPV